MYLIRFLIVVPCVLLTTGCFHAGFLAKRESELNCPTDIRQTVPWCAGEDAIFHCPCGPNSSYYGHRPTCWGTWPTSGEEWRDTYCAVPHAATIHSGPIHHVPGEVEYLDTVAPPSMPATPEPEATHPHSYLAPPPLSAPPSTAPSPAGPPLSPPPQPNATPMLDLDSSGISPQGALFPKPLPPADLAGDDRVSQANLTVDAEQPNPTISPNASHQNPFLAKRTQLFEPPPSPLLSDGR